MTLSWGALLFAVLLLASVFLAVGYVLCWCAQRGAADSYYQDGKAAGYALGYERGYSARTVAAPSVPLYPANAQEITAEFADCLPNVTRGPWGAA